jgi:hypothetical protein
VSSLRPAAAAVAAGAAGAVELTVAASTTCVVRTAGVAAATAGATGRTGTTGTTGATGGVNGADCVAGTAWPTARGVGIAPVDVCRRGGRGVRPCGPAGLCDGAAAMRVVNQYVADEYVADAAG